MEPENNMVITLFAAGGTYESGDHRSMHALRKILEGDLVVVSVPYTDIDSKIVVHLLGSPNHANELHPRGRGDSKLERGDSELERAFNKFEANHFAATWTRNQKMLPCLAVTTMNHSAAPNCVLDTLHASGLTFVVVYALCDIEPGAELTIDYGPDYQGPGASCNAAASCNATPIPAFAKSHIKSGIAKVVELIGANRHRIGMALRRQSIAITATGAVPFRPDGQPVQFVLKRDPVAAKEYFSCQLHDLDKVISGELPLISFNLQKIEELSH